MLVTSVGHVKTKIDEALVKDMRWSRVGHNLAIICWSSVGHDKNVDQVLLKFRFF